MFVAARISRVLAFWNAVDVSLRKSGRGKGCVEDVAIFVFQDKVWEIEEVCSSETRDNVVKRCPQKDAKRH